jgi:hypothetical protein
MCPVCIVTAALVAGKVTSAGGFSAIAIKKLALKKAVDNDPACNPSKLTGNESAVGAIVPNSNEKEK